MKIQSFLLLILVVGIFTNCGGSGTRQLGSQQPPVNGSSGTGSGTGSGSGSGTAPVHSVSVSWTDSTNFVIGYNVYRSQQSSTGYSKLNATPITNNAYQDKAVQAGKTYYYVATAVDSNGLESRYSNEASAVVPTP